MSDEGGVTPSEVVLDTTLARVTPAPGKGALGTWRSQDGPRTQSRESMHLEDGTSLEVNCYAGGVYVSQHLSFPASGRLSEESQGQNRTREIRPSGIAGGPGET